MLAPTAEFPFFDRSRIIMIFCQILRFFKLFGYPDFVIDLFNFFTRDAPD